MGRCCVCGREAEHIVHGLWWCDKHVDCTRGNRGNRENLNKTKEKKEIRKVELDLAWI